MTVRASSNGCVSLDPFSCSFLFFFILIRLVVYRSCRKVLEKSEHCRKLLSRLRNGNLTEAWARLLYHFSSKAFIYVYICTNTTKVTPLFESLYRVVTADINCPGSGAWQGNVEARVKANRIVVAPCRPHFSRNI